METRYIETRPQTKPWFSIIPIILILTLWLCQNSYAKWPQSKILDLPSNKKNAGSFHRFFVKRFTRSGKPPFSYGFFLHFSHFPSNRQCPMSFRWIPMSSRSSSARNLPEAQGRPSLAVGWWMFFGEDHPHRPLGRFCSAIFDIISDIWWWSIRPEWCKSMHSMLEMIHFFWDIHGIFYIIDNPPWQGTEPPPAAMAATARANGCSGAGHAARGEGVLRRRWKKRVEKKAQTWTAAGFRSSDLKWGVSINGGIPIAGWFISGKIHENQWMMTGGSPISGNHQVVNNASSYIA